MSIYRNGEAIFKVPYNVFLRDNPRSWIVEIDGKEYCVPKSKAEIDREDYSFFMGEWMMTTLGLEAYGEE